MVAPLSSMTSAAAAYERHKQRAADRSRSNSKAARDVGDIPPVADWDRRLLAEQSFRHFCEIYGAATFFLGWSDDHLLAIKKIERVVCDRSRFALAMPRGQGKTSLCIWAILWAVLTGRHRYIAAVAATVPLARKLLRAIKTILETNPLLAADFPEALHAIRHLEGESRACGGQLHHGTPTRGEWGKTRIVFPTIEGSLCSGAVIEAVSLLGTSRGLQYVTPDGETIRPTLVLGDDPQTDASARSPAQTRKRMDTLRGTLAGLVGAGESLGMLIPCTVIAAGDLAEQLLDHDLNPEFAGQRTALVIRWPDEVELWEENLKIRSRELAAGGDGSAADAHYRANRERMDAGGRVSWPDRFDLTRETSALQAAYYLRADVKDKFEPEYQNQPPQTGGSKLIRVEKRALMERVTGIPRGVVPQDAEALTAFVDVQRGLLFWMVVAVRTGLGGHVVAYGCTPDQSRAYFTKANASRSFLGAMPGKTDKANLRAAVEACAGELLGRRWPRQGGGEVRIQRLGIDVGDGWSTDTLWQYAAESKHASLIQCCKGVGLRARDIPFPERKPKPGQRVGHHWQLSQPPRRPGLQLTPDVSRWKSIATAGLTAPLGERAAITLHAGQLHDLECLLDHLTAEYPWLDDAGGMLERWKLPPGRDNDWFDCLIGALALASTLGVRADDDVLPSRPKKPAPKKARKKLTVRT